MVINLSKIPVHLKEKINAIPQKAGIYKMKDIKGNIVYVGKSKTLKSRVKSYFYSDHEWSKLKMLVFHIHDIDYIETDTHLEALLLECELIKKLKPMYNSQLKNHKKYKYLKINSFNRYKPVSIIHEREELSFGPYKSRIRLEEVANLLQNIYPIIPSEDGYDFKYKIFPETINKNTFDDNRKSLIKIFSDNKCMEKFLSQIEAKMIDAAANGQYEVAAIYRDMQGHLTYLYQTQSIENYHINEKKVLMGEKLEDGYKIFYISKGRIILKNKYRKINKLTIEAFLFNAKEVEEKTTNIVNEKRDLDFKTIIYTEIKDQQSKAVVFLEACDDVDIFMEKLICLNP